MIFELGIERLSIYYFITTNNNILHPTTEWKKENKRHSFLAVHRKYEKKENFPALLKQNNCKASCIKIVTKWSKKSFCKTHTPIAATHIATRTVTAFFSTPLQAWCRWWELEFLIRSLKNSAYKKCLCTNMTTWKSNVRGCI